MSASLKLNTHYTVSSADTDMFSRLKLSAMANYLIQSAISSAEQLGFGFADLKKEHLFWVLNRLDIELHRPIMWSEELSVETWPKNIERIFYIRDFVVRDRQNKVVAKATSAWLAIDISSKRPGNFKAEKMAVFSRLKDVHAIDYSPVKLGTFDGKKIAERHPNYYDIDLNKHVTSTRYIDWMMDIFPINFHEQHYPKHLSINYLKETMPHEPIILHHQENEKIHLFEGFNSQQDKVAFRGKITF